MLPSLRDLRRVNEEKKKKLPIVRFVWCTATIHPAGEDCILDKISVVQADRYMLQQHALEGGPCQTAQTAAELVGMSWACYFGVLL